ncbi:hypothetical protein H4R18_002395 [Coemansia javaensis]|uniref:Uncharacterized protein n=1 Tax=Coemansia javaensis TaxID=2761396 RepID=A0A9W8LJZ2_9FUNG|nr:hypothetical protein H4R18_002395 [Coemansia javaensis]
MAAAAASVEVLVLGRGFVGRYVADLLAEAGTPYAATTTDGRDGTVRWRFGEDGCAFSPLPAASVVVVTFPLQGRDAAARLAGGYAQHVRAAAGGSAAVRWICLGSTRAFTETPSTRHTRPDPALGGARAEAEEYMVREHAAQVLNLAGLWGGERAPGRWGRFYTRDRLRQRIESRSLHLLHGADAARAIHAVATCAAAPELPGGRWLVSDGAVYDVLQVLAADPRVRELLASLLDEDEQARRLLGARRVEDVAMGASVVARRIDPSHFWRQFGTGPTHPYVPT